MRFDLYTKMILTLIALLLAALVACGPAKPSGSEYLGKWEATIKGGTDAVYACPLDIARNGESFGITIEDKTTVGRICSPYEGVYTLTPEGNLKGGELERVLISFDKEKNQVAFSYGGLQYLKKR